MSALNLLTWLLQASTVPDTVIAIQVPADRSWIDVVIMTGQLLVSLTVVALLVAVVLGLAAVRKGVTELTSLVHTSYADVSVAARSVRDVAEDIRRMTHSVSGEVQAVGDTIHTVNEGVREVVGQVQNRLRRLDALVQVAQDEAEDFVVSSAATLRGLRFGASVLRRSFRFARSNGSRGARRRKRWAARREAAEAIGEERPRIRPRVPGAR